MTKRRLSASEAMRVIVTRPVIVITTLHENGLVNGGTFGAYTNVGPTEIGVAIATGGHTYQNLKRTGEFVINVATAAVVDSLAVFGASIPTNVSELQEAGLTPQPSRHVSPPAIAEYLASVECRYARELDCGHHSFVVGEVLGGTCDESVLGNDDRVDVVKAEVVHCVAYPLPVYAKFGEYVEGKEYSAA